VKHKAAINFISQCVCCVWRHPLCKRNGLAAWRVDLSYTGGVGPK